MGSNKVKDRELLLGNMHTRGFSDRIRRKKIKPLFYRYMPASAFQSNEFPELLMLLCTGIDL
jgi:hypothetical protein